MERTVTGQADLSKIPRLHIEGVDVQVGNEDVARRMPERLGIAAVYASAAAVYRLIPSSSRNYKRLVAAADTAQQVGLIYKMLGDNMNDPVRGLHLAPARQHLRAQNHPPLPVEQRGPDNEVRDMCLVFQGDKHDALGGPGPLPHHHQARYGDARSILRPACQGTFSAAC
jgi:hypothetical protein